VQHHRFHCLSLRPELGQLVSFFPARYRALTRGLLFPNCCSNEQRLRRS
jgi:hypothetical protein